MRTLCSILLLTGLALAVGSAAIPAQSQCPRNGGPCPGCDKAGGPGAGVVSALKMTPDQQAQFATLRSAHQTRVQEIQSSTSLTPDVKQARLNAERESFLLQLKDVLSEEQLAAFRARMNPQPGVPRGAGMGRGRMNGARWGNAPGSGRGFGAGNGRMAGFNLTARQQEQLAAARAAHQAKVQAVLSDSKLTLQARQAQLLTLRNDYLKALATFLTADQLKAIQDRMNPNPGVPRGGGMGRGAGAGRGAGRGMGGSR